MKRPTKYKHGDLHQETGRIFKNYYFNRNKWYEVCYKSTNMLDAHIELMYISALYRARKEKCPFDIDFEYLKSIRSSICPVFGIVLSWGIWDRHPKPNSPSLDKIKPEYGYIKGNVCIISHMANSIKQNVGYEELYKVADWLHEKEKEVKRNVKPEQLASLPTKSRKSGKDDSQLGFVFTTGIGEDYDDANDYLGATQGENSYRSAKEGGGNSMGYGISEVGAPEAPENSQDPGDAESTVGSVEEFFERVRGKSRELDLVTGATQDAIQQSDYRRIESLQRPLDEAFQSLEETLKELRETHYPDGYTHPSGTA